MVFIIVTHARYHCKIEAQYGLDRSLQQSVPVSIILQETPYTVAASSVHSWLLCVVCVTWQLMTHVQGLV